MPTPAQLAANRRNAQRSTGPKTPAGKARSARNALRHGLPSPEVVVAPDDGPEPRRAGSTRRARACARPLGWRRAAAGWTPPLPLVASTPSVPPSRRRAFPP